MANGLNGHGPQSSGESPLSPLQAAILGHLCNFPGTSPLSWPMGGPSRYTAALRMAYRGQLVHRHDERTGKRYYWPPGHPDAPAQSDPITLDQARGVGPRRARASKSGEAALTALRGAGPEGMTRSALAALLGCHLNHCSTIARGLEERGLVTRTKVGHTVTYRAVGATPPPVPPPVVHAPEQDPPPPPPPPFDPVMAQVLSLVKQAAAAAPAPGESAAPSPMAAAGAALGEALGALVRAAVAEAVGALTEGVIAATARAVNAQAQAQAQAQEEGEEAKRSHKHDPMPTVHPDQTARPPRVVIAGIKPGQLPYLENEFSGLLRLDGWWPQSQSTEVLRACAKSADRVIVMTDHIPHTAEVTLRAASVSFERVTGGLSRLRERLTAVACAQ